MICVNVTVLIIWQKMQAFAYLAFPNSPISVLPKSASPDEAEPIEHGIITSVTHGVMSGTTKRT